MAGMQARRLRPLLLLLLLLPALAAAFLLQQPNARGRTAAAGGAAALRPLRMAAAAAAVVEKDSRATKAAFERLFVKIANAEGPGQVNAECIEIGLIGLIDRVGGGRSSDHHHRHQAK